MKRARISVLLFLTTSAAHAQPATPEDFGLSPQNTPPPAPAPTRAPTPEASAAREAEEALKDERLGRRFRPMFKLQLGYQYVRVHAIPVTAGRMRLGIGAQNDTQAHYATVSAMVGETESERRVWDMRLGYSGEFRPIRILRLGLGLELGYLFIRRASIDERMWALGIGVEGHVAVDAVTWGPRDDHAFYVEGRLDAHLHFGNADMWGPTLSVGIRF